MLTLVEANKLANNILLAGIQETVINEDPLFEFLPFLPILGNSLTYNRINAAAAAQWYDVGETWIEGTPTLTEVTATLKIVGSDADTDNFLKRTRVNAQDLQTAIIQHKAIIVAEEIRRTLIDGDTTANSKEPNGLRNMSLTEVFANGSTAGNGATLTMDMLDRLIDTLRGTPTLLLMARRTRRKLSALFRASGSGVIPTERTDFGNMVTLYAGLPVFTSDFIGIADTVGTSTDCTRVFALRVNEVDGFVGLTATPDIIEVEHVGNLETKDATRTRIKAYISWALFNVNSAIQLTGVRD